MSMGAQGRGSPRKPADAESPRDPEAIVLGLTDVTASVLGAFGLAGPEEMREKPIW